MGLQHFSIKKNQRIQSLSLGRYRHLTSDRHIEQKTLNIPKSQITGMRTVAKKRT